MKLWNNKQSKKGDWIIEIIREPYKHISIRDKNGFLEYEITFHYINKGVVREIWISVITLKLIRNISESYDAMASKVDVLHRKMYNRQPQVIGKTFENLEIPGKPKELLVYGSKV